MGCGVLDKANPPRQTRPCLVLRLLTHRDVLEVAIGLGKWVGR